MKVVMFGATGMIGQGVLRECLRDDSVESVLSVGRAASGQTHAKLRDLVHKNLEDLSPIQADLAACEVCFFCLGVSSAGMKEEQYRKITYDLSVSVGRGLLAANPKMKIVFVSGAGTNAKSGTMWARVKGEAEDALLAMPFERAYMFRPGFIMPRDGITARIFLYRVFYALLGPFYPLWKWLFPSLVTATDTVGKAMIAVTKSGGPSRVYETTDINAAV